MLVSYLIFASYWRVLRFINNYYFQPAQIIAKENVHVDAVTLFDKSSFHVTMLKKFADIGWELKQYIDCPHRQWTFQKRC